MKKNKEIVKHVPLDKIKSGTKILIKKIEGGHKFISKVSSRGMVPGASMEVLQNYRIGPVIVYLRDSQIALGRNEAKKIIVGE